MKNFDPYLFKKKTTIYRPTKHRGIQEIWDWSEKISKYCKREIGKRYYAFKQADISCTTKQISKCFETFDEARRWRNNAELQTKAPEERRTFQLILSECLQEKESQTEPTTMETYRNNAKRLSFFNNYYVDQINDELIDEWLRFVKSEASLAIQNKTRLSFKNELRILKFALEFYQRKFDRKYLLPINSEHQKASVIDHKKFKEKMALNKQRFIPREEFEKLLNCFKTTVRKNPDWVQYYYLFLFQLCTGTRIGEACAIEWADVDFASDTVLIHRNVQFKRGKSGSTRIAPYTKTGENRRVGLGTRLSHALKELKLVSGRSAGLVFGIDDGRTPLPYKKVQYRYNTVFKLAKAPFSSTHILRHTYATDFLRYHGNQQSLQQTLGHTTVRQTEHYAKIVQEKVLVDKAEYEKTFRSPEALCLGISGKENVV